MTQPYLTDRSRSILAQVCPRARYWSYEYAGRGLSSVRNNIPLTVGLCVHRGAEIVMRAHIELETPDGRTYHYLRDGMTREQVVDEAVGEALSHYDRECTSRGLQIEEGSDAGYVYQEQRALIEAMIRAWALVQMPQLLEEFEVVEVEREEELQLQESHSDWVCKGCGITEFIPRLGPVCPNCGSSDIATESTGGVLFMSRPDAVLRKRSDGDLYILSIKTAAKYDERTARDNMYDMQGMSELAAVEARLLKEWPSGLRWCTTCSASYQPFTKELLCPQCGHSLANAAERPAPKVMGIQMAYLLKGERSRDYLDGSYSGPYTQNSPLIRPYMKQGIISSSDAFAWKFQYTDDYGNKKRLGKGWHRVNIWEVMPVKDWIQMLASGEIQPEAGDCLSAQFILPPPIYRNEDEVQDWLQQISNQERRIAEVIGTTQFGQEFDRRFLNEEFPQHRRSCTWPTPCQFIPLCHEGLDRVDPLSTGLYRLREAHHEKEVERFANAQKKE